MRLNSIKSRIMVYAVLGLMLLIIILGSVNAYYQVSWLKKEFDEGLKNKASVLVTLVKYIDDEIDFDFADEFMPEFERELNSEYFQIWTNENTILEKSNSLGKGKNNFDDLPVTNFNAEIEHFENLILPDGRDGRMVWISFFPQIIDKTKRTSEIINSLPLVTLAIAKERESLNKTLLRLIAFESVLYLLFILIAMLIIWMSVVKGLIPLTIIKEKMASIATNNLSERVSIKNPPDEIIEVIEQFNDMTDRLEKGFARERDFSSNVAHELRTPISEIRTLTEVALKQNQGESFYPDILDSTKHMQLLVENLMALARTENDDISIEISEVRLFELINLIWQRMSGSFNDNNITLDNTIDPQLIIKTSPDELEIIINNLLSNAINHSIKDSQVRVHTIKKKNHLCLTISNPTQSLNKSDLNLMFDRLWRKDRARTSSNHAGLGLALVKTYSDLLDLSITTDITEDNIFTISVCGLKIQQVMH